MTPCYTCGRRLAYADPAAVLTVPWTEEERDAWRREQFGALNIQIGLYRYFAIEAPFAQTYTICRDCIQPVIHARVPSAQALQEQFRR